MPSIGRDHAAIDLGCGIDRIEKDEDAIGVYSTGERIAVPLVLNRFDLLPRGGYSALEAIERLGAVWTKAALVVQRPRQ